MTFDRDYYDMLQVSRSADTPIIRAAVKEWRRRSHPDVGGDAELFKAVGQAEEILCGPRRGEYDAWLRSQDAPTSPPAPRQDPHPPAGATEFTVRYSSRASFTADGVTREFGSAQELFAALRGADASQQVTVRRSQWLAGFAVRLRHDGTTVVVQPQAPPALRWPGRGHRGPLGGSPGDAVLHIVVVEDPAPPPAQAPVSASRPAPAPESAAQPARRRRSAAARVVGRVTGVLVALALLVLVGAFALAWFQSQR